MSAILSLAGPDTVYLLTDGAGYDSDGVVRCIGRKVRIASKARLAVATRGFKGIGDLWAEKLTALADRVGVDDMLLALPLILAEMELEPRSIQREQPVEVVLAGWSPAIGAFHRMFRTYGENAFELTSPAALFYGGQMSNDPRTFLLPPLPGEGAEAWMRRGGLAVMQACRSQLGRNPSGDVGFLCIGGQIDLTTISADRVTVETIHTWPDRIGEKIVPELAA
ncbi:hypothetical protein [Ensifer sesbaniae]|uniref:hypothetical protein n=1 Tax=Ensifer sesbaniae TaxID=1214071 RepID=UPI00156A4AD2|nr:hypothetical protein [Ensifer sesbaniae]NRQ15586.1 hypothetical protein [Ensifer sesbaniae]